TLSNEGLNSFLVRGKEATNLVSNREVLYAAGTSQASKKTIALDNMIKAMIRENFTAPSDSRRIMPNFSVEADLTAAAVSSMDFSWKNCLDVWKDMCNDSITRGTYLTFDVIRLDTNTYLFKTFT